MQVQTAMAGVIVIKFFTAQSSLSLILPGLGTGLPASPSLAPPPRFSRPSVGANGFRHVIGRGKLVVYSGPTFMDVTIWHPCLFIYFRVSFCCGFIYIFSLLITRLKNVWFSSCTSFVVFQFAAVMIECVHNSRCRADPSVSFSGRSRDRGPASQDGGNGYLGCSDRVVRMFVLLSFTVSVKKMTTTAL